MRRPMKTRAHVDAKKQLMKSAEKLRALLSAYRIADSHDRRLIERFEQLIEGSMTDSEAGSDAAAAIFSRAHFTPGHLTASALIVDSERRRLGLIFHKKLGLWLQPGGHFEEGERDPLEAARREAAEEIGLHQLEPLSPALFDLDVHEIPARPNEPAHLHHDLRFAFIASGEEAIRLEMSEVSDFAFVELDALIEERFEGRTDASVRRAAKKLREVLR